MKKLLSIAILWCLILPLSGRETKIVGLIGARNESNIIAQSIRALSLYTDAIVYLDDASDDDSVTIAESIAEECRVRKIITKETWFRDEPGDRTRLLEEGRRLGGTHFIMLDADEVPTANCLDNQFLKKKIAAMAPGDHLEMRWFNLWRSVHNYRADKSVWRPQFRGVAFADDGKCNYQSSFIHTPRIPRNLKKGRRHRIDKNEFGVLHFQFVNWHNLLVKQAWYRCLECIRQPKRPASAINAQYAPSKNEVNLGLKTSPSTWFLGYDFFDSTVYDKPVLWRQMQVLAWFEQYGASHFADLDIWDIDWGVSLEG